MKKGKKGNKKPAPAPGLPKRGPGQPTIFSDKVAQRICERLSNGESLRSICRDKAMPAISTVLGWLFDGDKKQFSKDYERARAIQADVVFEETIEIADSALKVARTGKVTLGNARVAALRVQIDTRKWALGRMNSKYVEKLDLTTKGKELKQPRPVAVNYVVPPKPKEK